MAAPGTYAVGDVVEARFGARSKWFPGKIDAVSPEGLFTVQYDDGDCEDGVRPSSMRRPGQAEPVLRRGSPVDMKLTRKGKGWHPATVGRIDDDGRLCVIFEDGDTEWGVDRTRVIAGYDFEPRAAGNSHASSLSHTSELEDGDGGGGDGGGSGDDDNDDDNDARSTDPVAPHTNTASPGHGWTWGQPASDESPGTPATSEGAPGVAQGLGAMPSGGHAVPAGHEPPSAGATQHPPSNVGWIKDLVQGGSAGTPAAADRSGAPATAGPSPLPAGAATLTQPQKEEAQPGNIDWIKNLVQGGSAAAPPKAADRPGAAPAGGPSPPSAGVAALAQPKNEQALPGNIDWIKNLVQGAIAAEATAPAGATWPSITPAGGVAVVASPSPLGPPGAGRFSPQAPPLRSPAASHFMGTIPTEPIRHRSLTPAEEDEAAATRAAAHAAATAPPSAPVPSTAAATTAAAAAAAAGASTSATAAGAPGPSATNASHDGESSPPLADNDSPVAAAAAAAAGQAAPMTGVPPAPAPGPAPAVCRDKVTEASGTSSPGLGENLLEGGGGLIKASGGPEPGGGGGLGDCGRCLGGGWGRR